MGTASLIYPTKKRTCRQRKLYRHPWITRGILNSREHRLNLLEQSKHLGTPEARLRYTRYRNKLTHIIEKAKIEYNGKGFEEIGDNVKKVWRKINSLKKTQKNKGSTLPEKLIIQNSPPSVIENPKHIANELNKHFVQKG